MHCVLVAGARPNFVKIAPVLAALEHLGARVELVHTGQHYDDSMSKVFFDDLNIRPPDHHLRVGSDSHARQTAEIMIGFETLLHSTEPDWVIVVGDVNSTVACGLVSAKSGIPLAHIEAGLRSRDWSMPEEINRVVTDRLSDVLFATSDEAAANLRSEGYRADQIELVGNVMVDSLLANLERAQRQPILEELSLAPRSYALATLHRPSNVDNEATLSDLMDALGQIALGLPVIFPAHPRTAQRLQALVIPENVQLLPPASYLAFIALESQAALVLTDSGGVQEETTALGVPCLTLRLSTERPITITEGSNQVAGTDPDRIVSMAHEALNGSREFKRPALWDGLAGQRIASSLVKRHEAGGRRLRPTDLP